MGQPLRGLGQPLRGLGQPLWGLGGGGGTDGRTDGCTDKGFLNKMFFVVFFYRIEFKFVQFITKAFNYKSTKSFFFCNKIKVLLFIPS